MLKYLIIEKTKEFGNIKYQRIGQWTENLSTVNKNIKEYEKKGFKGSEFFVLEKKDYSCIDARIKERINEKWYNTPWINISDKKWNKIMRCYTDANIEDYINYRQNEYFNYENIPSIEEWILHNEYEQRKFIFYLYENGKIKTK